MTGTGREESQFRAKQNREVFARFGLAMYFAQCLEIELAIALVTTYGPGPNCIAGSVRDRMLQDLFSETLGLLVKRIGKAPQLSEEDREQLNRARDKRNWLAHEYFLARGTDLLTESGRISMIEELQELADFFEALDKLFTNRTVSWLKEAGFSQQEMDELFEKLVRDASG